MYVRNECAVGDCSRQPDEPHKMPGCRVATFEAKTVDTKSTSQLHNLALMRTYTIMGASNPQVSEGAR